MDVSIIIPTYDRPNNLREVIDSYLVQQNLKELIIIDDASCKSYSEINEYIFSRTKSMSIKYIYHKNQRNMGAAYCRNKGLSFANCDYIFWGEDDAFLSSDYVFTLQKKMRPKQIMLGSIYYGITPQMSEKEKNDIIKAQQNANEDLFNYTTFEGYYRKIVKEDVEVPYGHALILVPKLAYDNISYFEGYNVNGYREESDAQVQMIKSGYKIIYTSSTECYHLPRTAIESGGQHKKNYFKKEIYTIMNTFIFYNRHFNFLKERFNINGSIVEHKLHFVIMRVKTLTSKLLKKIKKYKIT